jgi:hypothetical protein
MVVVLADNLGEHVEGAGGDHDIVDLGDLGHGVGHRLEGALGAMPIIAWRGKPTCIGSVTPSA